MNQAVWKLDEMGKPAWIALMVVGFVLFWPIGLGILAFLIASGRMGCRRGGESLDERQARWAAKWDRKMEKWGLQGRAYAPSGNHAFDDYRSETLKRLEEEEREFRQFLERLRMAKDKAEFDQFMADRRSRPAPPEPPADAPRGSN
jgi:hypothetical protein